MRMITLKNTMINADYIVNVRVTQDDNLRIQMSDGTVHMASKEYWNRISGYEHIVQVIPCTRSVDVIGENGAEKRIEPEFLCVTADGSIRTLGMDMYAREAQL